MSSHGWPVSADAWNGPSQMLEQLSDRAYADDLGIQDEKYPAHEQSVSREDPLSEFLRGRRDQWMRWFENEIEARYEDTRGGLVIIADVLQQGFDPKCFGLAFIQFIHEGRDCENAGFAMASEQKEHLRQFIEQLAARMGIQNVYIVASAVVLIIERTIVNTLMTGSLDEVQTARLLLQCLQHV